MSLEGLVQTMGLYSLLVSLKKYLIREKRRLFPMIRSCFLLNGRDFCIAGA